MELIPTARPGQDAALPTSIYDGSVHGRGEWTMIKNEIDDAGAIFGRRAAKPADQIDQGTPNGADVYVYA